MLLLTVLGCKGSPPAVVSTTDAKSDPRGDWVVASITEANADITEQYRNDKYCKMLAGPFPFYRGTAHLFWADFSAGPILPAFASPHTTTWVQGDLHAMNFGVFDNDEGEVVYDLNDFDDAVIADYSFDLVRLAASISVAGMEAGLDADEQQAVVEDLAGSYVDTIDDLASNAVSTGGLELSQQSARGMASEAIEDVIDDESRVAMLDDWSLETSQGRAFDYTNDRLAEVPAHIETEILAAIPMYRATLSNVWDDGFFEVLGIAQRLSAGIGSLGKPRYYVLIDGPTTSSDDDLLLDIKLQGQPSATVAYSLDTLAGQGGAWQAAAQRSVDGQYAMGKDVDDLVGVMTLSDGSYRVTQRSPFKESIDLDEDLSNNDWKTLAKQWGQLLAAAHSRSDLDHDPSRIAHDFETAFSTMAVDRHDELEDQFWAVSGAYAAQVAADYDAFSTWLTGLTCP